MKKVVSAILAIALVCSMSIFSMAAEARTPVVSAEKQSFSGKVEVLETKIAEIKKDFPEARISVEEAVAFEKSLAGKTAEEKVQIIKDIYSSKPIQTFQKAFEDGSTYKIEVFSNSVTRGTYIELGRSQVSGGTTSYTGTKVISTSVCGISNFSIWYYVDHYKTTSGTSGVTNAYSYGSTIGSVAWQSMQYHASQLTYSNSSAELSGWLEIWQDDAGWVYSGDCYLIFYASSMSAQLLP